MGCTQAIVFLPLIGAVLAGLISLAGARARHPGGSPPLGAEDHAAGAVPEHAHAAPSHHGDHAVIHHDHAEAHEPAAPPAGGSRSAELITTVCLFGSDDPVLDRLPARLASAMTCACRS